MMKLKSVFTLILAMAVTTVLAGIPEKYYISADGEQGLTLKARLCDIIKDHTVLSYSSLWNYYPATYNVNGTSQVLDMYSPEIRYYNGTSAVSGMNKEHTVPKSWWGGGASCNGYSDLFNVIPSEQNANSRKSNYSLGIVSNVTWTNNVTTVGKGTVNGYSDTFFEPKDEYKGDFARIYFYMATCYPNAAWDTRDTGKAIAMTNSNPLTLKSWIIPMLLKWNVSDPVDSAEIARNENIYKVQGNRNPFIDYPVLAEYIWGNKSTSDFNLSEHKANDGTTDIVLYAGKPDFSVAGGTKSDPYEISDGATIRIKTTNSSSTLYVRINDGEWKAYEPTKGWNSTSQSEYYVAAYTDVQISGTMHVEAYCTMEGRADSETISYWYKGTNFSSGYVLYEAFDEVKSGNNTSTSGSSSAWNGNSNFPTVTKVYQAGNAIKLGTGSATGSITSKVLNFIGGTLEVKLDVKGWTNVEGSLKVTVGDDSQIVSYKAKMADDFETLSLTFSNVPSNPTITIETTSKRAFVDNIRISASDSSTGIMSIDNTITGNQPAETYDLTGRRISGKSRKGIMIIRKKDGSVVKTL